MSWKGKMSECSNCFCWRPWIYKILCLFTGSFGAAARMLLFIVPTESVFVESDFLAFTKACLSLLTHLTRHGEMSSWMLGEARVKKKVPTMTKVRCDLFSQASCCGSFCWAGMKNHMSGNIFGCTSIRESSSNIQHVWIPDPMSVV